MVLNDTILRHGLYINTSSQVVVSSSLYVGSDLTLTQNTSLILTDTASIFVAGEATFNESGNLAITGVPHFSSLAPLTIQGCAQFRGSLNVSTTIPNGTAVIVCGCCEGQFDSINGITSGDSCDEYTAIAEYRASALVIAWDITSVECTPDTPPNSPHVVENLAIGAQYSLWIFLVLCILVDL